MASTAVAATKTPTKKATAAATKTPTKKATVSKKPTSTKAVSKVSTKASHPTYFEMIKEALLALHERNGSSPYAISKYIEEKHKAELPSHFKKILSHQLRNSVLNGKLIKIKASYKLSDASKKPAVEKKPKATTKAVVAKKPKATTKVAAAPKAKAVKKTAAPKKPVKKAVAAAKKVVKAAKKVAVKKVAKATPVKRKALKTIKSPANKRAKKA